MPRFEYNHAGLGDEEKTATDFLPEQSIANPLAATGFFSVRSGRQSAEQIDYNLLLRRLGLVRWPQVGECDE